MARIDKLHAWRLAHEYSYAAAARRLGLRGKNPGRTYQRYENGERLPAPDVMRRIVAATNGTVQPNDFYRLEEKEAAE